MSLSFKEIFEQFNFVSQAKKYNISLWQHPPFLFFIIGLIIIGTIILSYIIGTRYFPQEYVALGILLITAILFSINYIITNSFERLAEVNLMKSEFIDIISHQLRTPLANLKWTIDLALKEHDGDKKEDFFKIVQEQNEKMLKLVNDMVYTSRIEQGKWTFKKEEIDLKMIVEKIIQEFLAFAQSNNVKIKVDFEETLPKVFADSQKISHVVSNLLSNPPESIKVIEEHGDFHFGNILINKDGRYKLKVTPKTNHKFTAAEPDIRYKDLYDFIYKLGDPAFAETAQSPKRVDVVLEPIGAPYSRSPDYISREYIDVLFKGELYTKIALRTVHPKTIVKVMVDGVELTEDGAGRALPKTSDKEGYWLVLIKKEVFSQTGFSIELIKNPQYYPLAKNNNYFSQLIDKLASLFFKKVSAQQSIKIDSGSSTDNKKTIIKFEPILEYIEGFSYDNNNKIIPRAKVNIKLKMNDKIYSSTTTDDSGFFTMYPKNLPPYEFYLEIINPETKKVAVQTTGEFVKKNQAYLDSEKINLIQATKQDQKIINPTIGELNNIVNNNNQPTNQPTTSTSTKTAFNPTILIIISVIALLVIVALGLVLYIKKSQGLTKPY